MKKEVTLISVSVSDFNEHGFVYSTDVGAPPAVTVKSIGFVILKDS